MMVYTIVVFHSTDMFNLPHLTFLTAKTVIASHNGRVEGIHSEAQTSQQREGKSG
jgi:hypothetical protein